MTQLTHGFDDVIHPPHMSLRKQTAVGVDGLGATEPDVALAHIFACFSASAEAKGFELQQNDVREAVVDLQEVHVLHFDTRHLIRAWRGKTQPHLKRVGSIRDVVSRVGMAFGAAEIKHTWMTQVFRVFTRRYDDRCCAIGFDATVELAHRLRDPRRVHVVVEREFRTAHQGLVVQLGVGPTGKCDLCSVFVPNPVQKLVTHQNKRIKLRR